MVWEIEAILYDQILKDHSQKKSVIAIQISKFFAICQKVHLSKDSILSSSEDQLGSHLLGITLQIAI